MAVKPLTTMPAAAIPTGPELLYVQQGGLDTKITGTQLLGLANYATAYPGVDSTGVADSSVGLQAAIDATPSGGILFIPPGTYLLTGSGSQILNRTTPIRIIGLGSPNFNVGSGVPSTRNVIRLAPASVDSSGWEISGISMLSGFGKHGIFLDCTGGAGGGWFDGARFTKNIITFTAGGNSIFLSNNTTPGGLANSVISENRFDSISLGNCGDNITVSNNIIDARGGTNECIFGYQASGGACTRIIDNVLTGKSIFIDWEGGVGVIISGNELEANVANAVTYLLAVSNAGSPLLGTQIINNCIVGLSGSGITIGINAVSGNDTLIMGGRIDIQAGGGHILVGAGATDTRIDQWSMEFATNATIGSPVYGDSGTRTIIRAEKLYKGTTASTASGTPVTIFTIANTGRYIVTVSIASGGATSQAIADYVYDGAASAARIAGTNTAGMTLTLATNTAIQATQTSGSPFPIIYTILYIPF